MCEQPRIEFYRYMDAANVDLKAFTENFYWKICGGHLQPVLDTLVYLKHETDAWFEITNLLIPGENDSDRELEEMTQWVVEKLGPDVPMHFTAFHPDWKMMDTPHTAPQTLTRARRIAMKNGVRYAYTGNVHDEAGGSTYCHQCGAQADRSGLVCDYPLVFNGRWPRSRLPRRVPRGARIRARRVGRRAPAGKAGKLCVRHRVGVACVCRYSPGNRVTHDTRSARFSYVMEVSNMNIRCTMDPISWREITNLDAAPCLYEGDGENGIEIYFENEADLEIYRSLGKDHQIVLEGNDSDDYIAEG